MTALPTRKLEAYRYADIDALRDVWYSLAQPERIEIAAQQKLQQILFPNGDPIDVLRLNPVSFYMCQALCHPASIRALSLQLASHCFDESLFSCS
jgi:hypothetical protein